MRKFIKRFKNRLNNQEGFTLLEVIISIAILAVSSVFILEMFVTSADANLRAKSYDTALSKAVAFIEEFKSREEPPENSDIEEIEIFYDKNFIETSDQSLASYKITMTTQEDTTPKQSSFYTSSCKLFGISVTAVDLKAGDEKKLLLEINSAKYFPN